MDKTGERVVEIQERGKSKSKCLKGGGRKALDDEMKKILFHWIIDLCRCNLCVSRAMIIRQAKHLSSHESFKGSIGSLNGFLKRKCLSLRRKTTVSQTPDACIRKLVDFIVHLRKLQISQGFTNDAIFVMDETACWMNMPADTTVEVRGARLVSVKTTGHEKNCFTVILTAKADGTKLKPFLVFKGKGTRLMNDLSTIPGVVVRFNSNGWMNDSLTIEYLKTIIGSFSFTKRLMVWDAYKCHVSEAVKAECRLMKLEMAVVPGGCTKFVQAADLVWNASFKSLLWNHYDTWPSCHKYTKGGNMKPPSRSLLCNWVKSSLDAISSKNLSNHVQ